GPRPEVLDWAAHYTPEQREVFRFKPGLSDPVQLLFRHEHDFLTSADEYRGLSRIKVQRQIEYLRSRTAWSDVVILLRTARTLFPSQPSDEERAIYASLRADASARSSGVEELKANRQGGK